MDNGREFCNALNDRLCKSLGINHRLTTPYHPQTNGLAERYTQKLCNVLAKYVGESQDDWDRYIHQIAFATRRCQQKSTKATPFYLTYGREAVLPVELDIPTTVDGKDITNDDNFQEILNDRAVSFATLLRCQQDAVKEVGKAQHIQKKYYDAKHFKQDLAVGEKVLVKNSRRINRKGDKIMSKWVGPYTIAECVGKGVYKLEERKSKINRKSFKKFYTPTSTPSKEAFCNQKQPSTSQSFKKTSKRLKAQRNNLPTRTRRSRRELSNRSSKPSTKLGQPQQSATDKATKIISHHTTKTISHHNTKTISHHNSKTISHQATKTITDQVTRTISHQATKTITDQATKTISH
ncbi:uncharacterized protein K02A2.6-like [Mizuhopecten yessoensis]|uniref:uncharacterized protein K02A2.6-like n=1 Tax=Mizuhopecten yessoensis TaxID=6573 RepID=UPI000B45F4A6|nr:uncharacterized protein K02A2.6-like [Mizuhopecten yessoensis]